MPTEQMILNREALRKAVRFFYDVQKLRVINDNRAGKKRDGTEQSTNRVDAELTADDKIWTSATAETLHEIELSTMKEVRRLCRTFPIHKWIVAQKGVSWGLCGVLLSEVDIDRCETPSALWRYAGLGVVNGQRERPTKGQKLHYNKWLKTKMYLLADCCVRARSGWRDYYDNYKTRKQNTLTEECMACEGTHKVVYEKKTIKCPNCKAGTIPPMWGKSDGHRHNASLRYLGKMFLLELFKQWRTLEGLDVPPTYSEAMLGRKHGDHGGAGDQ